MKKNMTYIWMKVTLCVMGLFCLAILIQTVRLKVFEVDNYREKLNKIQNQKVRVEPRRGDILARDGRKLACSVPSYKICMDPCAAGLPDSVFNKNIWKLATQLSLLFRDKTPEEYRAKMLDACADIDEEIMMMVLEEEEVPEDMIRAALRKGTIDNTIVPVVCGTSYRNKGVQKLLDAIVDYMPSPLDIPAIKGIDAETEEECERHADDNAPFSALLSRS